MGRLPRKKSPAKKKKKENGEMSPDVAVKKASVSSGNNIRQFPSSQKKSPTTKSAPGPIGKGFSQSIQFLREVKAELKKVTWPSRKQTTGSTVVVIVLVIIMAFFLGVVDIGLSSIIQVVLR